MRVWAMADFHLSFAVEGKKMDVFGDHWLDHPTKIKAACERLIKPEDLFLIAGDHSWALHFNDALVDLNWIADLPGTKVLIKGNHDLWANSITKIRKALPKNMYFLQNDSLYTHNCSIAGARMWDESSIGFSDWIIFRESPKANVRTQEVNDKKIAADEKIFFKELERLKLSLKSMRSDANYKIAMLHYPPTGPSHQDTAVTKLMDEYEIDLCVYGHLHNLKKDAPVNFTKNNTRYCCTACDFLNYEPLKLIDSI
jgi:uncharacterized protein